MSTFFDSFHCSGRAHCPTCRSKQPWGVEFRESLKYNFEDVTIVDFECPHKVPWRYTIPLEKQMEPPGADDTKQTPPIVHPPTVSSQEQPTMSVGDILAFVEKLEVKTDLDKWLKSMVSQLKIELDQGCSSCRQNHIHNKIGYYYAEYKLKLNENQR